MAFGKGVRGVRRFGHHAVGVAQGSTEMFSAFESGGPMWTGQGPRVETRRVDFDESFSEAPVVHVALIRLTAPMLGVISPRVRAPIAKSVNEADNHLHRIPQ